MFNIDTIQVRTFAAALLVSVTSTALLMAVVSVPAASVVI